MQTAVNRLRGRGRQRVRASGGVTGAQRAARCASQERQRSREADPRVKELGFEEPHEQVRPPRGRPPSLAGGWQAVWSERARDRCVGVRSGPPTLPWQAGQDRED